MRRKIKLSASMSLAEFRHGYWYATELKQFADRLGIRSATALRKDQLERAIERFLQTGTIEQLTPPRRSVPGMRDVDRGLRPGGRIIVYTNDRETKAFLEREARKLWPPFKPRSGARYRLNRWRESQLALGLPLTYRDLVREYVRLCRSADRFARIPQPHGRYVHFVSDFFANHPNATRGAATKAWHRLKNLNKPKTYAAWAEHESGATGSRGQSSAPRKHADNKRLDPGR